MEEEEGFSSSSKFSARLFDRCTDASPPGANEDDSELVGSNLLSCPTLKAPASVELPEVALADVALILNVDEPAAPVVAKCVADVRLLLGFPGFSVVLLSNPPGNENPLFEISDVDSEVTLLFKVAGLSELNKDVSQETHFFASLSLNTKQAGHLTLPVFMNCPKPPFTWVVAGAGLPE